MGAGLAKDVYRAAICDAVIGLVERQAWAQLISRYCAQIAIARSSQCASYSTGKMRCEIPFWSFLLGPADDVWVFPPARRDGLQRQLVDLGRVANLSARVGRTRRNVEPRRTPTRRVAVASEAAV